MKDENRRIVIGLLWVGLFVMIGRLAGAAKEVALAWRYGVSETVDAYVFVFNLITWPVGISFSVLTVVLVPTVARLSSSNPDGLVPFGRELFGVALLCGASLGLLSLVGVPLLLQSGLFGLSGGALEEALKMAAPLSLLVPVGILISLFSAWMMACGYHKNTLLEALPALVILGALLVPSGRLASPLLWGTVVGFALNLAFLMIALRRTGHMSLPVFRYSSSAWTGFWSSVGIMTAGQILISATAIIDQIYAAGLGHGAISSLSYAQRIVALILSLGGLAISRATLPIFSEVAATQKTEEICDLAFHWAKVIAVFGAMAAVIAWIFSPWIVEVLFQRGAFSALDTARVSSVMRFYLIHVPIYFYALVLASALSSQKRYFALFVTGVIAIVVKPLSNYIFANALGVEGIALASTVLYAATALYMTVELRNRRWVAK